MAGTFSLEAHWVWMILAAILGVAEILVPGFFLIWLGLAALITGVVTLLIGIGEPAQFALFAVLAIAAVYAGRRWFVLNPIETSDPKLNDRVARLIGEIVVVEDAIVSGSGRVRVGDGEWNATGPDTPAGVHVRIIGAKDGRLIVEPISSEPAGRP